MRIRPEYKTLGAIVVVAVVTVGLLAMMPFAENFGTVSSRELDSNLYDQLDEYLRTYENDPHLTSVFKLAMTQPEKLTGTDRQSLLNQEREFLDGWELAWTYRHHGRLDSDRYAEWNDWYIEEIQRRPDFVWTENRDHFPEAFALHVDQSISLE